MRKAKVKPITQEEEIRNWISSLRTIQETYEIQHQGLMRQIRDLLVKHTDLLKQLKTQLKHFPDLMKGRCVFDVQVLGIENIEQQADTEDHFAVGFRYRGHVLSSIWDIKGSGTAYVYLNDRVTFSATIPVRVYSGRP